MLFREIELYTSERCNLACKYCFLPKNPKDSTVETLKGILDYFFQPNVTGRPVHIHIFGTEPLYRWDLLEFVYTYADELADKCNKELTKGMTTNGVALTQKRADWLTRNKVRCLCSIDGLQTQHDKWRTFPGGNGSWKVVSKNFKYWLKLNPMAEAAMTVTPDLIPKLRENVEALYDLGFCAVALNKCIDSGPRYSSEDLQRLEYKLNDLIDLIVTEALSGITRHAMFLTNGVFRRHQGRARKNPTTTCGASKGSLAADIHGNFYICHRAIYYPEVFSIGRINNGIDWERVGIWRNREHPNCRFCINKNCSPCYVINYIRNKDIHSVPWDYCRYNQIITKKSRDLEQRLKEAGVYLNWLKGKHSSRYVEEII